MGFVNLLRFVTLIVALVICVIELSSMNPISVVVVVVDNINNLCLKCILICNTLLKSKIKVMFQTISKPNLLD